LRSVLKGLQPEDRVVVNGLIMLRPGVKVEAQAQEGKSQVADTAKVGPATASKP
jgi:hypothetical protein